MPRTEEAAGAAAAHIDAAVRAALANMKDLLAGGSGALEGRLREVEATAGDLDKKLRSVSAGVPLLIEEQKRREREIWDFVQAHLQRSGWYEERLSRIASAVDEKPSESQVRAMMRQLDANLRIHCGDGAALAVLVERIHGELTRKVGRRDVIRLINVAVEGAEGRLARVAALGARDAAYGPGSKKGVPPLPHGADPRPLSSDGALVGAAATALGNMQGGGAGDPAKHIFAAIGHQIMKLFKFDGAPGPPRSAAPRSQSPGDARADANAAGVSPLLHLDGAPASSDLPYPGGEPPRSPPHTGPHTTTLQPETAASLQEKHRRAMTPGSNRDFVSKQEAARWAAAAAAAAVMGLSLDAIAGLAAPPAALGEPGGPLLHPLHVKQRGRPSFPANQPDLKPAPNGAPLTKQTYVTPPNQLILASYPNGRPGALRALQRAPSAAQVPDDYGAAEDVMRVSLSRKTIARAPIGRRDDDGLDPASWDGAN